MLAKRFPFRLLRWNGEREGRPSMGERSSDRPVTRARVRNYAGAAQGKPINHQPIVA